MAMGDNGRQCEITRGVAAAATENNRGLDKKVLEKIQIGHGGFREAVTDQSHQQTSRGGGGVSVWKP